MFILLIIAVGLLYLPWMLALLFLPVGAMHARAVSHPEAASSKWLSFPYRALNWLSRGGLARYCLWVVSYVPSCQARKSYYRCLGARIGRRAVFHFKTELRSPWKLTVGEGSIVGDNVILDAREGLAIGRNVNMSSNVSVYTLQHNHRSPEFSCDFPGRRMAVKIKDRAWLGSNTVVLPGVIIGEGAVVCAGAVVTKDVGDYEVVAGIPARKVGERPRNLTYEFDGKTSWFI